MSNSPNLRKCVFIGPRAGALGPQKKPSCFRKSPNLSKRFLFWVTTLTPENAFVLVLGLRPSDLIKSLLDRKKIIKNAVFSQVFVASRQTKKNAAFSQVFVTSRQKKKLKTKQRNKKRNYNAKIDIFAVTIRICLNIWFLLLSNPINASINVYK